MAHAELADRCPGIDVGHSYRRHLDSRSLRQRSLVDPAEAMRQLVEVQVFGNAQGWNQVQFLHHHADAEMLGVLARARLITLAVEQHAARG